MTDGYLRYVEGEALPTGDCRLADGVLLRGSQTFPWPCVPSNASADRAQSANSPSRPLHFHGSDTETSRFSCDTHAIMFCIIQGTPTPIDLVVNSKFKLRLQGSALVIISCHRCRSCFKWPQGAISRLAGTKVTSPYEQVSFLQIWVKSVYLSWVRLFCSALQEEPFGSQRGLTI